MARKIGIFLLIIFLPFMLLLQTDILAGQQDNVKDYLNYLTPTELDEVQSLIEKAVVKESLDIVIVLTEDTQGKSSRDYADDYYDDHGFGVGSDYSGVLMLINMGEREIWISTTGKAIDLFTDLRITTMTDSIAALLSEDSYYEACLLFLHQVDSYAQMGVPEGQHRTEIAPPPHSSYFSRVLKQMKSGTIYLISLLLSMILTIVASFSSKGKATINNQTYEDGGSFKMTDTRDDYLRETTTRVRISSNNTTSGGGGVKSSTHKGSSGRTHGGGGRKF